MHQSQEQDEDGWKRRERKGKKGKGREEASVPPVGPGMEQNHESLNAYSRASVLRTEETRAAEINGVMSH